MSISRSDPPALAAIYFDGKVATGQPVRLSLDEGVWVLRSPAQELRWSQADVQLSERLGNTPRRLSHVREGHCEIADLAGLQQLLQHAGTRSGWLERMQHNLWWALLALVLMGVFVVFAYRDLLPWAAEKVAMQVPDAVLQKMGSSTLQAMDKFMLQESHLDEARQQTLTDAYRKLIATQGSERDFRILFRSSPKMGANAFALPDGNIVMLDELVELAPDDVEILAVLAHERGHVERRHAMRMVLQSSVVGLVLAWYLGDVSTLLAGVPAMLMQAKYSRDMEQEADVYASQTLVLNGLSPCLLSSMLGRLEQAHRARDEGKVAPREPKPQSSEESADYFSSHPATPARKALLCPAGTSP